MLVIFVVITSSLLFWLMSWLSFPDPVWLRLSIAGVFFCSQLVLRVRSFLKNCDESGLA